MTQTNLSVATVILAHARGRMFPVGTRSSRAPAQQHASSGGADSIDLALRRRCNRVKNPQEGKWAGGVGGPICASECAARTAMTTGAQRPRSSSFLANV